MVPTFLGVPPPPPPFPPPLPSIYLWGFKGEVGKTFCQSPALHVRKFNTLFNRGLLSRGTGRNSQKLSPYENRPIGEIQNGILTFLMTFRHRSQGICFLIKCLGNILYLPPIFDIHPFLHNCCTFC